MTGQPKPSMPAKNWFPGAFAGVFGAFLGLSLLKFGNPPIMEKWVTAPANIYDCMYGYPWPIAWALYVLGLVAIFGLFSAHWKRYSHGWLLVLSLLWIGWHYVSATQEVYD